MAMLLDPKDARGRWPYTYVPSAQTDLRKRFADERKRLEAEARADVAKVTQLKRGKK